MSSSMKRVDFSPEQNLSKSPHTQDNIPVNAALNVHTSASGVSQVKQILFDCDNTLVLSEDLAFEAVADLANSFLTNHGVETQYTCDMLIEQFVGQNFRGILQSLMRVHNISLPTEEVDVYVKREENAVIAKLDAKAKACPGANDILAKLFADGKYGLAVVSSSAIRRVRAALDKADQSKYFKSEYVFSAATSMSEPTAKPDPAVYNFALKTLDVRPEDCVAIEDSKSGATAACRANIRTIAYVGSYNGEKKQKEIAALLKKTGCKEVMYSWSEFPSILAKLDTN